MKVVKVISLLSGACILLTGCSMSVSGSIVGSNSDYSDLFVEVEQKELDIQGNSSSKTSEQGVGNIYFDLSDTTLLNEYDQNYEGEAEETDETEGTEIEEDETETEEETETETATYSASVSQTSANIIHTLFGYSVEINTTSSLSNIVDKTGLNILAPDLGNGAFIDYTYVDGTAVVRYEVDGAVAFFVTSTDETFSYMEITNTELSNTETYDGQKVYTLSNNVYDATYFEVDETKYLVLVYNGSLYSQELVESAISNL